MRLRAPRAALPAAVTALSLAIALSACRAALPPLTSSSAPIQGEGTPTTETRTVGAFAHVSVEGGVRLVASTGAPASVTVTAQPNLLPRVATEVEGDQLVVSVEAPGFSSTEPVTVTVVVPVLESITLAGGPTGSLEVVGSALTVDVSGGAVLDGSGRVDTLTLTASSGARADLGKLSAGSATVTLSGGAEAEVAVAATVAGSASGGATLRLATTPQVVDVDTSSGGSVQNP